MSTILFPEEAEKQRCVLTALLNGHHLTTQRCFRQFGTTELRRIVSRLRKRGYDIRSFRRAGENFKTYYLKTN